MRKRLPGRRAFAWGVPCQAFPPGALQAESAESACAWKEAFTWESVAALLWRQRLGLQALASGRLRARRVGSARQEVSPVRKASTIRPAAAPPIGVCARS